MSFVKCHSLNVIHIFNKRHSLNAIHIFNKRHSLNTVHIPGCHFRIHPANQNRKLGLKKIDF